MLAAIAKPVNALNAIVLILDLTSVRLAKFFFISVTNFKPKRRENIETPRKTMFPFMLEI